MKTGLCLAGGGVKGAAHIGAIKAFEEKNINDVSIESVDVYAEESVINNFKNKFKNVIVEKINEKY